MGGPDRGGGALVVAGTDNSAGTTYRRELEMYARAGTPASKVLQIATIDAARFMKDDTDYGSVSTGRVADILVINGTPSEHIGDLPEVETVIRGGRYYKVADLLTLSGMPGDGGRSDFEGAPHRRFSR